MNTFSPAQKIPSQQINENFAGLASGEFDDDDNSLRLWRTESANPFCTTDAGLLWSVVSGLSGALTAGVIYLVDSGIMRRVEVSAVVSKAFTASKDTYVTADADGTVHYDEQTNGASIPALASGRFPIGLVITDGSGITKILSFVARRPNEIGRSKIILGQFASVPAPYLPARENLKITAQFVVTGGTLSGGMRFNNDSASNYANRTSDNNAADTTGGSAGIIGGIDTGSATGNPLLAIFDVLNTAANEKGVIAHFIRPQVGAANVPGRRDYNGKWANTSDQITRVDIVTNSGTGGYGPGTQLVVREA